MFENIPPVLSVKDLRDILGKDRATVYRWLKRASFPGSSSKVRGVIYRDEVKDYLLSRHNQTSVIPPENTFTKNSIRQDDTGQEQSGPAVL